MAGVSWLVDKKTIAARIKNASTSTAEVHFESNPCISCPNCQHVIDNNNLKQQLPRLPKGVKFDPSDQDIMSHLLAKVGAGDSEPHPFIDEFITTIEEDGGICYTHPQHLPGISQDGNVAHFFHKAIKAYNSGGRKRRRVFDQDIGDLRWHKTGRTRPILLDGVQRGSKKIMVLYTTPSNGKAEKTGWIVHQYHVGREEEEKEGEYVVSKIFYQQQQQVKLGKKDDQDVPETSGEASITKVVDPVTPNFVTPELLCNKKQCSDMNQEQESQQEPQHISQILPNIHQEQESHHMNQEQEEPHQMNQEQEPHHFPQILPNVPQWLLDSQDDYGELPNIDLSMIESQNIEGIDDIDLSLNLFSQQFSEESPFMFDFLPSYQSPIRNVEDREQMEQPSLSGFAHFGAEQSQKDIEECQNPDFDTTKNNVGECQNLDLDTGNVELDPQSSDFHLSQLINVRECQNLDLDTGNVELDPQLSDFHLSQLNNVGECQNLDLDTGNVELDHQPSDFHLSQLNNVGECQNLDLDTGNVELDHQPSDFHLSQLNNVGECQNLDLDSGNVELDPQQSDFHLSRLNNVGECQNLDLDTGNVEFDPQSSDFHLSQLDFSLQDSYIAWDGSINKTLFK